VNAASVKEKARALGADLVGIADVATVQAHPAPGCPRGPSDILVGAKSVVVLARRLLSGMSRELDSRNRNVHYAGEMLLSAMESLTYDVVRFLEDAGHPSLMLPSGYSRSHQIEIAAKTLSLPHLAVEAGLGTLGLNLQLLTPEFGPRVILGAVLTTVELESDAMRAAALCEGPACGRCLLSCPGDAIRAWQLDLDRCKPHSSPYGYHFLQEHMAKILASPDAKERVEAAKSGETLMIWQSMLRGVGIYTGCTRCADVCPVGADYDAHLREIQEEIAETTAEKEAVLARMKSEPLAADLAAHRRWIGAIGEPAR
jgi:epoxyqueuosine reductase QueG